MAQQIRYYKKDGTEYELFKQPEIKITQTSNADMNIGIPKKLTAVSWLVNNLPERFKNAILNTCAEEIEQAKQMEEGYLKEAMHYALDEDGHTGEWKNKFVNNYYANKFKATDNEKEE